MVFVVAVVYLPPLRTKLSSVQTRHVVSTTAGVRVPRVTHARPEITTVTPPCTTPVSLPHSALRNLEGWVDTGGVFALASHDLVLRAWPCCARFLLGIRKILSGHSIPFMELLIRGYYFWRPFFPPILEAF